MIRETGLPLQAPRRNQALDLRWSGRHPSPQSGFETLSPKSQRISRFGKKTDKISPGLRRHGGERGIRTPVRFPAQRFSGSPHQGDHTRSQSLTYPLTHARSRQATSFGSFGTPFGTLKSRLFCRADGGNIPAIIGAKSRSIFLLHRLGLGRATSKQYAFPFLG